MYRSRVGSLDDEALERGQAKGEASGQAGRRRRGKGAGGSVLPRPCPLCLYCTALHRACACTTAPLPLPPCPLCSRPASQVDALQAQSKLLATIRLTRWEADAAELQAVHKTQRLSELQLLHVTKELQVRPAAARAFA